MALGLARRGLGLAWPNPSVGCIIVNECGHVIGRGHTGKGGRPHGETVALSQAGSESQGATAYVTLEPCAHHGQTPPCAEALVKAGISRVIIATGDPDKRVSGKGKSILEQAGIAVVFGICQAEAEEIAQGFLSLCTHGRPMVTMKVATSMDSKVATFMGESKWITGPESRQRGHLLRSSHDAILVGIGTVLADNPELDCRISGLGDRSPICIVMDSHLKIPIDCKLVNSAKQTPLWLMTTLRAGKKYDRLEALGVKIITCEANSQGQIDIVNMMFQLGAEGITRLLSEGGAQVNSSLIRASLVDRLYWFRSDGIIGGDGLPAIQSQGLESLDKMAKFSLVRTGYTGNDIWLEYKRRI